MKSRVFLAVPARGLSVALSLLLSVAAVSAQSPRAAGPAEGPTRALSGRVVKGGEPVAGAAVTIHRVTPSASGPIAQLTTGRNGRFDAMLPPPDTAGFTVHFATVDYQTVRYFGSPVHAGDPASGYTVEVFDTTSALPGAVRTSRRDVILVPEPDGSWTASEIVRIRNSAARSLVSAGGMPTAEVRLPTGATGFEAGEGDLPPDQIRLMGERVLVLSALAPGDRELFFRYRLAARPDRATFALAGATDTLNLFVRQPSPALRVSGLSTTKQLTVEGEQFLQYAATGLASGASVEMQWDGPAAPPVSPVVAGAAAAGLVLLLGSWAAVRNRSSGRVRA